MQMHNSLKFLITLFLINQARNACLRNDRCTLSQTPPTYVSKSIYSDPESHSRDYAKLLRGFQARRTIGGLYRLSELHGGFDESLHDHDEFTPTSQHHPETEIFCRQEKLSAVDEQLHSQERFRSQTKTGIDLIGDGAVTKNIVRKGHGEETPKDGDMVYIHYRASIANGRDFDDSRCRETAESRQGLPFGFTLGKGEVMMILPALSFEANAET